MVSVLVALSLTGCGKSSETSPGQTQGQNAQLSKASSQSSSPVLRLHWIGKKNLATDPSATNFMSIWNMPESFQLQQQTLEKLSTAPWRLSKTSTPLSNAPVALLRPLLDDLVQEESYLEVNSATNHPTEVIFAIKLPTARAAVWMTNAPVIFASVIGASPTSNSQLLTPNSALSITNHGEWTILAIHPATDSRLSALDLATRLSATSSAFSNQWVQGHVDFAWLKRVFNWEQAADSVLPQMDFTVVGKGNLINTTAKLVFPTNAPIEIEPWNIPTNLVHDPLIGFMAVRGFRPLLKSFGFWDESSVGATPNQITFWEQDGHPALRFFAFPTPVATNQIQMIDTFVLNKINPAITIFPNTTNMPVGAFESLSNGPGLRWRGFPFIMPRVEMAGDAKNQFITAGLFANRVTNRLSPEALRDQFNNDTSLLLYDWEQTQPNAYALIQIFQATRFVFGKNRLSITNNAALPWIAAIAPRLGQAGTSIRQTSQDTLTINRTSTLGLTGAEIHLLIEWLESPTFPLGLFVLGPTTQTPATSKPTPK